MFQIACNSTATYDMLPTVCDASQIVGAMLHVVGDSSTINIVNMLFLTITYDMFQTVGIIILKLKYNMLQNVYIALTIVSVC